MKASRHSRISTLLAAALAGATLFALAAPAADAGILVATANGCPAQSLSKPFAAWGDTNKYFLAPGGAFESGNAAWTLGGGAKVVSGNEPFKVHGSGDSRSLSIPQGGVATSPTLCVGINDPSIRWFSKQQSLRI